MPNTLDLIYALESSQGRNKQAYTQDKYGALGAYQLQPPAYLDVQRHFPDKWGKLSFKEVAMNDKLSRQAAGDYLTIISEYLASKGVAPTREALLAGYQAGMGNVVRGKATGPRTMQYLKRAESITKGGR